MDFSVPLNKTVSVCLSSFLSNEPSIHALRSNSHFITANDNWTSAHSFILTAATVQNLRKTIFRQNQHNSDFMSKQNIYNLQLKLRHLITFKD